MKVSQLIKKLQSFKEKYGDKGVYTWSGDDSEFVTIKKVEREILEENREICYLNFDLL
jgi:hypothetical protein